ncbi:MAG TPA: ATP-binding cassette domain-containing protein [Thermoplasmata archaeon]|nr:ATP-binding cassette domain-containing protein [Thermoplasmata archaeon]HTW77394.1 ATP-binding cassette domain-containing protein [Thermoplasmata archaeon]
MPDLPPAIDVRGLTRVFESRKGFLFNEVTRTEALAGIDLKIENGAIFGLLGPNGAGKTTLTKILATLLLPTAGSARVLGHDVARDAAWLRPRMGLVLGGERGLYNRISGRENLRYFADLYGIPLSDRERRIQEVLERVGVADAAERRVEEYSRGMKQKLHLARGILHWPQILFLDEPTIGLDPKSAREVRKLVRSLVSDGVTIFLTTHYMFEAEELCPELAILSKGRIVARDSVAGLRHLVGGDRTIEVEAYGFDDREIEGLRRLPGVSKVVTEEYGPRLRLTIRTRTGETTTDRVRASIPGRPELTVRERVTSLEDVYLDLVEEATG